MIHVCGNDSCFPVENPDYVLLFCHSWCSTDEKCIMNKAERKTNHEVYLLWVYGLPLETSFKKTVRRVTLVCVPKDFRLFCRALQGADRTLFPGESFGELLQAFLAQWFWSTVPWSMDLFCWLLDILGKEGELITCPCLTFSTTPFALLRNRTTIASSCGIW